MAYNPIQFQQGMSLPEFLQCFGTEAACAEAVRRARWPHGFFCPRCNGGAHCVIVSSGRPLFQCNACHRQTSLNAGTGLYQLSSVSPDEYIVGPAKFLSVCPR